MLCGADEDGEERQYVGRDSPAGFTGDVAASCDRFQPVRSDGGREGASGATRSCSVCPTAPAAWSAHPASLKRRARACTLTAFGAVYCARWFAVRVVKNVSAASNVSAMRAHSGRFRAFSDVAGRCLCPFAYTRCSTLACLRNATQTKILETHTHAAPALGTKPQPLPLARRGMLTPRVGAQRVLELGRVLVISRVITERRRP